MTTEKSRIPMTTENQLFCDEIGDDWSHDSGLIA